ncbi:MAG TPA: PaaX family transcriptional regulator C-terminal domain-containing protein [Kineosporiaceae bacterium]
MLLTLLGIHLRRPGRAVYSGSVIDVLERIGISEQATRSTVSRMARRGLLHRFRSGRRAYLAPTDRLRAVLEDGHRRIWQLSAVNRSWDGTWTLVGFSLPDTWNRQRHDLRSRLTWARFGMLHPGLWVAPGRVDATAVIDGLGLADYLTVMHGSPLPPTEAAHLVARGYDLTQLAADYKAFLDRWSDERRTPGSDAMTRQLLLHSEWLQLIRRDPHLPAELLPGTWPAIGAEQLFHRLAIRYQPLAQEQADRDLQIIVTSPAGATGEARQNAEPR